MATHLDGYWFGWSLIILITVDQSVMRSVKAGCHNAAIGSISVKNHIINNGQKWWSIDQ